MPNPEPSLFQVISQWASIFGVVGSLFALVKIFVTMKQDAEIMKVQNSNRDLRIGNVETAVQSVDGKVEKVDDKVNKIMLSLVRLETKIGLGHVDNPQN